MGEIKSVKVDNWGVFFLQKLQNFFNKTDYCDLTLQFNDNSQLKVHRLVLSACTDYFNVLEQTCEVVDDALIMPNELQADVVVPIVNFMYTGTLEFELKMYGKLLRTAKEMNMTVLLKLLEAHRRTMESGNRWQRGCDSSSPKNARKRGQMVQSQTAANIPTRTMGNVSQQQQQQQQQQSQVRRTTAAAAAASAATVAGGNAQHRVVQTKVMSTNIGSQEQYRQQIGSTTLTKTSDNVKLQQASAAYESALLMKHENDDYEPQSGSVNQSTSPFEQLRKGYNNNKRPSTAALTTPASKRPNIEDVKEFAEQQRMRKQIAAEYGDDPEYEGGLDDDIHNDDDDDDPTVASSSSHLATGTAAGGKQSSSQAATSIIIKQDANDKPTIVVKDSPNSKMNHAKIISEVLRQYPHLVKSNKNIKLKIMQNVGGQTQKIILKKDTGAADIESQSVNTHQASMMKAGAQQSSMRSVEKAQQQHQQQPHQERVVSQKTTAVSASATSTTTATAAATTTTPPGSGHSTTGQKRCIDSRTMHALIALGAENTTGPWLCLKCGINGRPISIPSYRGFRRHLINTHKETIDAALCEHCGWRSMNNRELHYHMQLEHKVKTSLYTFSECAVCGDVFVDANTLNQHTMEFHPEESQQQCIYCNKIFAKDIQLYTHLKSFHKKQAAEDGIIDYSDDELGSQEEVDEDDDDDGGEGEEEEEVDDVEMPPEAMVIAKRQSAAASSSSSSSAATTTAITANDKKVKIISDISLPNTNPLASSTLESRSNATTATAAALNAITSGIGIHDTSTEEFITSTDESTTVLTAAAATKAGVGGGECATNEPKFVSADGNEMILTEEQRKEIMSQLNQDHEGGVVMVLNESAFTEGAADDTNDEASQGDIGEQADGGGDPQTEDELIENAAEEEEYDDSHIYNEFAVPENSESESRKETEDDERESITRLETTHAPQKKEKAKHGGDGGTTAHSKKEEDISKKLKELTGDWSDDENDDDEDTGEGGMLTKSDDESRKIKVEEDLIVEDSAAATAAGVGAVAATAAAAAAATTTEVKRSSTSSTATVATTADENRQIKEEEDEEEEDEEENGDDQTEDDIDIALKSLHKGIEPADSENRDISSSERGCSFKKTSSAAGSEDIDVKDISTDESSAAKKAKIVKGSSNDDDDDDDDDDEEEEEGEDDDGGAGGGGGGGDDSRDAKETLLEELGGGVAVVDEKVNIKDDIGMIKKAVDNMDVEMVESNVVKVEENNGDDTTLNIDPLAVSKEDMEGGGEKTTAVAAAVATVTDSSSATKTKTADKVKSLISEWGDDDDDDEEDDEEGEEDEEDA